MGWPLVTSQALLRKGCARLGALGAPSLVPTRLFTVPGNLPEKQNPRPTLNPLASPSGALHGGSSPLIMSPTLHTPSFHGGSEQEALGVM